MSVRRTVRIGAFDGDATGLELAIPSGAVAIHIHGTFVATITLQGSNFPRGHDSIAAAWAALSGAITAEGFFAIYEPVAAIRAVCSGYSSGDVYVDACFDDDREV